MFTCWAPRIDGAASAANERNLIVEHDETVDEFLVSDRSETEITDKTLVRSVLWACTGLVGIAFAIVSGLRLTGVVRASRRRSSGRGDASPVSPT